MSESPGWPYASPCPRCGRPVVSVHVRGPIERYAVPCGCRAVLTDGD